MSYKEKIAGCFGTDDGKFARHQTDLKGASELLKSCVAEQVKLDDLINDVSDYLSGKTYDQVHIQAELRKVREMFSGWLD